MKPKLIVDASDIDPVVVEPPPADLVSARAEVVEPQELHDARLQALDDELLEESRAILRDAFRFRDIDISAEEPPQEWIDEVGEDEARRRFRIAQAAWACTKNAPVGIALAQRVYTGIAKARAMQDAGKQPLNVVVQVIATPREYPRRRLPSAGESKSGGG